MQLLRLEVRSWCVYNYSIRRASAAVSELVCQNRSRIHRYRIIIPALRNFLCTNLCGDRDLRMS